MKKLSLKLAVAAAVIGFAVASQAVQITGNIKMSGTVFLNNQYLGSATAANSFGAVTVGGIPDGSFTGVTPGTSVNWTGFGWNPESLPSGSLWSFNFGGSAYSFDLTDVYVVSQDNYFLSLRGSGILNITGGQYDPTFATWSFSITHDDGNPRQNFDFTFANSQTATVADGGITAILLGSALTGLAFIRRKLG